MIIRKILRIIAFASILSGITQSGTASISLRVFGGSNATEGAYPWMVTIYDKFEGSEGFAGCGASLISSNYVLTAAHCVDDMKARETAVRIGTYDPMDENRKGTLHTVKRIIVHDEYNTETLENDIALMELEVPSDVISISPITPSEEQMVNKGDTLSVLGFGSRGIENTDTDTLLQKADINLVGYGSLDDFDNETVLYAGYENGRRDACQGDSGGPLIVYQNSKARQIGVVSFGSECGFDVSGGMEPGGYTRLSSFSSWIVQNTTHLSQTGKIALGYQPQGHELTIPVSIKNNSKEAHKVYGQTTNADNIRIDEDKNCTEKVIGAEEACVSNVMLTLKGNLPFEGIVVSEINIQGSNKYLKSTISAKPTVPVNLNSEFSQGLGFYSSEKGMWIDSPEEPGAIRSGTLTESFDETPTSTLQTIINGPARLTYEWKLSSNAKISEDWSQLRINNLEPIYAESDKWESVSVELAEGEHTVSWEYMPQGESEEGDDSTASKNEKSRYLLVRKMTIVDVAPTDPTQAGGDTEDDEAGYLGSFGLFLMPILAMLLLRRETQSLRPVRKI